MRTLDVSEIAMILSDLNAFDLTRVAAYLVDENSDAADTLALAIEVALGEPYV